MQMRLLKTLPILLLLFWGKIQGETYFDFNTEFCQKAQTNLLNLKLGNAYKDIENEKKSNPDNAAVFLLSNYLDYLRIFITEDKTSFDKLNANERIRIYKLDQLESDHPFYLLSKAEIKLQWGILKLKMDDHIGAAKSIRESYILLLKNQKKFPDFEANLKTLGWVEAMVSSVPDKYNWMVNLLGVKGNFAKGIEKLEQFAKSQNMEIPDFLKIEGQYSLALILHHIAHQKQEAIKVADQYLAPNQNTLSRYMLATLYNTCGENEKMLKTVLAYRKEEGALPIYQMDFLTGVGLLRKAELGADIFLINYLQNFKGNSNLCAASYFLAQQYHLQGNKNQTDFYLKQAAKKFKPRNEQDKQAQKESQRGLTSNKELIKSRLYFDGAYFDKALSSILLAEKKPRISEQESIEVYYRKARILHALNDLSNSIEYYSKTIESGRESERYFAANAALQLGILFEEQGDFSQSKVYFIEVIKGFPNNKEYQNSLEQKAKSGLERIKHKSM